MREPSRKAGNPRRVLTGSAGSSSPWTRSGVSTTCGWSAHKGSDDRPRFAHRPIVHVRRGLFGPAPWMAALTSLFLAFFVLACSSEEASQPDGNGTPKESIRVGGEPFLRGRGGDAVPVARTGGRVSIERAVLSSAGDADLVQARVEYKGAWAWPRCSLVEGPDTEAVRRIIENREPPRSRGYTRPLWEEGLWDEHESPWADRSTIEKSLLDGGIVLWTFHEDPNPEGEAADPRRTPFFVRCAGGDLPDVVHDLAHVLGTPGTAS